MPYLSTSEVMTHEKVLYQVYVPLPLPYNDYYFCFCLTGIFFQLSLHVSPGAMKVSERRTFGKGWCKIMTGRMRATSSHMGTWGFQEEARSTATELERCRQERSQENGHQLWRSCGGQEELEESCRPMRLWRGMNQEPGCITCHATTHTLHFNSHFSRWTWVSQLSPLILLLHLFLDCASFRDRPKLSMSFLTQSHQFFFGRPLCLIPSTFHVIQRLTQSLSSLSSTSNPQTFFGRPLPDRAQPGVISRKTRPLNRTWISSSNSSQTKRNKKLSWCWQTHATRLEVNQGHHT